MKRFYLASVFLFIACTSFSQNIFNREVGQKAYDFIGIAENGEEVKISDFKGKYVLLNFTATFCPPCWMTYDVMDEVQQKYGDKLKVISFHLDDDKDKWEKKAKELNIDFKCTSVWEVKDKSEVIKKYNAGVIPNFLLIDKNGIVVENWVGSVESKLKDKLKEHLG